MERNVVGGFSAFSTAAADRKAASYAAPDTVEIRNILRFSATKMHFR
jgi:hypothetical protein